MNYRRLSVIEAVAPPIISPAQFKLRARIDTGAEEDEVIEQVIASAQVMVENHTGLALVARKLQMNLSHWPRGLDTVFMYPYVSQVDSVTYLDDAGVSQTLDPSVYDVDLVGNLRPTISLSWGQTWPVIRRHPAPVQVRYTVGPPAQGVSPDLVSAIFMIAMDLFENREAQITSQYFGERSVIENPAMRRILRPHTIWGA